MSVPQPAEATTGLQVLYRTQGIIDPGDSAPPQEEFVPANNFDENLSPGLKLLVRGPRATLLNTTGLPDDEALEGAAEQLERLNEIFGGAPVAEMVAAAKVSAQARRDKKAAEAEALAARREEEAAASAAA